MNKIRTNSYILGKSDTVSVRSVICEVKMKQITRFKFELPNEGKIFIQNEIKYLLEEENNTFGDISQKNDYGTLGNLTEFGESGNIENKVISSAFNGHTNGDEIHDMDNNRSSELIPGCGVQDIQLENACLGTHSKISKTVFTECSSAEILDVEKGNTKERQEKNQSKNTDCFSKVSSFDLDLEISDEVQITRTLNSEFKINQNENRNSDEVNSVTGSTSFSESEYVPSETSSLLQSAESDCFSKFDFTSGIIKEKSDTSKKQENDCFIVNNRASKINLSNSHETKERVRNEENNVQKYGVEISDLDNGKGELKESFVVKGNLENFCSFNSSLSKSDIYDLNISDNNKVQKRINVQSNIMLGSFQKDEQITNEFHCYKADLLYEHRVNEHILSEDIQLSETERADCFSKRDSMFSTTDRKSSKRPHRLL